MKINNFLRNKRNSAKIISTLLTICLLLLVTFSGPISAHGVVGIIPVGNGQADQPPRICIDHRDVTIGNQVDSGGINDIDYRTGMYAFTGEQISYRILVRDPNGAEDIGKVHLRVNGQKEAICSQIPLSEIETCNGLGSPNYGYGYGYGYSSTDKAFECILTVEQSWYGEKDVLITVYNSRFQLTDATHKEKWFFNPEISFSMTTSDGKPIRFEEMPYGADTPEERTVHSLNRMVVKNTAEGGVNMWMYLAGTDFYSSEGVAQCPDTNKLSIENMAYRAWSGTQWQSWEGWVQMSKYNQNAACTPVSSSSYINEPVDGPDYNLHPEAETNMICYGGLPVPYDFNVAEAWQSHFLTNQGRMEVEFKLTYPIPCIGDFDQGSILVFSKVV
jgi:hypothetical protein